MDGGWKRLVIHQRFLPSTGMMSRDLTCTAKSLANSALQQPVARQGACAAIRGFGNAPMKTLK